MIHIEQAVYGTFKFTEGFSLVSASKGLDVRVQQEIIRVCKSWGEILIPSFGSALYHVPIDAGSNFGSEEILHLVGKVIRQGTDGGGRTAWYQQVLAIPHDAYIEAGADCFSFQEAGLFKDRWFETDRCAEIDVETTVLPTFVPAGYSEGDLALVEQAARALISGMDVCFSASALSQEIPRLFRLIVNLLPLEFRSLVSLATFAFCPTIDYDLWCIYAGECPWPRPGSRPIFQVESAARTTSRVSRNSIDAKELLCSLDQSLAGLRAGMYNEFLDS